MSNSLVVRVGADIRDFQREMKKLTRDTDLIGKNLIGIGSALSKKVTAPLVAMGTASIAAATTFEKSMSKVETTVTGASNNMDKLTDIARTWGRESIFNANQVAEAMAQKGLSGLDTIDIYNSMADTIALATSANMDLATATSYLTNVMGVFNKSGEDASLIADMMTSANKTVDASIADIAKTFGNAGSAIATFGISLEDATMMTALMADASLTGAKAGTAMRAMFDDLAQGAINNADEFAKLGISIFDANGEMHDAETIVRNLRSSLGGMSTAQQIAAMEMMEMSVTGQKALVPMLNATDERVNYLTQRFGDVSGAADHYAAIMKDNVIFQTKIFWNNIRDIGIEIGNVFLPALNDVVGRGIEIARTFSENLSPEMARNIVRWGSLAAAIGPTLVIGGKTIIMLGQMKAALTILAGAKGATVLAGGKLHGVLGLGSKAAKGATASLGTKGLGKAVSGTAKALLGVKAAPLLAVAGAGVVAYKHFSNEVIPVMDLFSATAIQAADGSYQMSKTVSESTAEIVGSFMDMSFYVGDSVKTMWAMQTEITEENSDKIIGKFDGMHEKMLNGWQQQRENTIQEQTELFASLGVLTDEELEEMYTRTNEHFDGLVYGTQANRDRIYEILATAKAEERALTERENQEIQRLNEKFQEKGVRALTSNAIEQEVILANLKNSQGRIDAERASNAIKQMNYQRDNVVRVAEEEKDEIIRAAWEQYSTLGTITADQRDTIIKNAREQAGDTIAQAERLRTEGIDRIRGSFTDLERTVNTETGAIRTHWDRLRANLSRPISAVVNFFSRDNTSSPPGFANGTHSAPGGLSWVNERGPELIDLPQGSRVIPAPLSRLMTQERGRELARMERNSAQRTVQHTQSQAPIYVTLNGRLVGELLADDVTHNQNRNSQRQRTFRGSMV